VYTAAEIFPMLPEKLSTNLTSLNPDQDRLAVVVEMTVAADGSISDSAIYRATVRNHAKLAYNGVAAWLEGTAPRRRRSRRCLVSTSSCAARAVSRKR
jgi:exoribonuclease-2